MTSRFPGPWRIAEFPNGFAVYDATGRQLGFFYGRPYPNPPGHAGFLMIDEARQIAIDFAKLSERLDQTSARSEVATSTEDDKPAKLETNRSPQGAPETSRILRAAQLSIITVTGSPLAEAPTTIRRSIPFEADRRRSTRMLRRPSDPFSIRKEFLIVIAIAAAALPAGYLFFGDSDPSVNVAVVPQATTNRLSAEFPPLREARVPLSKAAEVMVESRIEPEVQTAPLEPTAPLDVKPVESGIELRPSPPLPEKGSFVARQDASPCFPSASAVRENHPLAWPSWTLRAAGHENTRCWYAATRIRAHHNRSEMRRKETVPTTEKLEGPPLLGVQ
jgi:hypothetical protein